VPKSISDSNALQPWSPYGGHHNHATVFYSISRQ